MTFYIIIAILSGVSIVLSRIINANLAERIGLFQSTFYNFLTGLMFSTIIFLFINENYDLSSLSNFTIPFYAYFGGLIGVFSITLSNYTAPKISAFYMTLLIFIGQIVTGIIIDYFLLNELSVGKIVGSLFVTIGLSYNLYIDRKSI